MRPVTDIPAAALPAIAVVLCDIDDTLTTDGHLTAAAYTAMERLSLAGIHVVLVRPYRAHVAGGRGGG